MQLLGTRRLTVRQAALDQHRHALAYKAVHFGLAARRRADLFQHAPASFGQVGDGIEQRTVEIEGDRFEMHQTLANSPRRAPMIES